MKKLIAVGLSLALLVSSAGCASKIPQVNQIEETTAVTEPVVVVTDEVREKLDEVLVQNQFEGIVRLTHNGEVVYESVSGVNDLGEPLTADAPMYMGSISKQFCATAILMLRDQGKLSLDDTLAVYFPEYTIGKDITLKNLLCMRSGIVRDCTPMWEKGEEYLGQTKEENMAAFKEWVFAQPLDFEPDSRFFYCNVNYTLLSFIVEAVSGQSYPEFIRRNILEPLGMSHTGFVGQIKDGSELTKGLTYETVETIAQLPIGIQGCGDIISTASDMELWMTALESGQVLGEESYLEMTTNYNPELPPPQGYGYGLETGIRGGMGHGGKIGNYATKIYFNESYGYNLYMASSNEHLASFYDTPKTDKAYTALLSHLFTATDAAKNQ